MTDIVEKMRARKNYALREDWKKGKNCPECGYSVEGRMKCAAGLGGACQAYDPHNYDLTPEDYVASDDPECAEAAKTIEILRVELESCRKFIAELATGYIESQRLAAARFGFEPGKLQWAWRQGERTDLAELECAICDALGMGGISAWPGDGVGCAAQIVTGYAAAVTKEKDAEIERLRAALKPFACKCTVKGEGAGGNCETKGECFHWNARAGLEGWQPTHRHVKRGSTYTHVGTAKLQSKTPLSDMDQMEVYRSEDGQLWVRPSSEFHDGRFVEVKNEG